MQADAVSNNHFDEDGLAGILALLEPSLAGQYRELMLDVARAGDFGVYSRRQAARIAFTIAAYADANTSPLPPALFERPYPELAAELHVKLLDLLPRLLTNVDDYRALWEREDARLTASERLLDAGAITIDERPGLDLAIVRVRELGGLPECHPYALHSRTGCTRLIVVRERSVDVQYRYEGWVQMASRRPAARVDLSALAAELNREEEGGGRWAFDGVDQITPLLHLDGGSGTSIDVERIVSRVETHLRTGAPAWDPYRDGRA